VRKPRQSRLARAGTTKLIEAEVAEAMLDHAEPSVLMTDGYKFSMAQAGFPLRRETFYLSFRKPGSYYIPFDFSILIRELLPDNINVNEHSFLNDMGYKMTDAMSHAMCQDIEVWAAPAGTWVKEREPILTVTGPSFLVSWLEPLVIAFHFPIQIATHAKLTGTALHHCTCNSERDIIHHTLEAIEFNNTYALTPDADAYLDSVRKNADALVDVVGADRIFEVGMRGATCLEMHRLALWACRDQGITKTSNVWGSWRDGMDAVGTTGHEHQQRWGYNDLDGFRAIRDMRPQPPSYLFDTYNAMELGIPAAIMAMLERPDLAHGVRFDERKHLEPQLRKYVEAESNGIRPMYTFMDGISAEGAREIELLCETLDINPDRGRYGSGGFLVCDPAPTEFTRNRVSAVYKLCQTSDRDVMKIACPGKESLPGKPVIFRSDDGKQSLVGQAYESAPKGFHAICPTDTKPPESTGVTVQMDCAIQDARKEVRIRMEGGR